MNDHSFPTEKGKGLVEGKYYPNTPKDIKKKLVLVLKKINDLSQQRKSAYKNSVKVKRVIHNQVNQIVKCLRARERSLWSEVDEAYLSQDVVITDELLRLQSLNAHCQALFNHIEDCNSKQDILPTLYGDLSVASLQEIPDMKPLQFISDFEGLKTTANNYGYVEGDFAKKDDFVLVAKKNCCNLSDMNCKKYCRKVEVSDQSFTVGNTHSGSEKMHLGKRVAETDCEGFQIVDLMHNMAFQDFDDHDFEDCIMADDENERECNETSSSENGSAVHSKIHNNSKHSCKTQENNEDFDPEKEWHEIKEMNRKIASFDELASKLSEKSHTSHKNKEALDVKVLNMLDKKYKKTMLIGTRSWLQDLSAKNSLITDTASEKVNIEINYASPTDLIKKAFKPYFTKDDIQSWLMAK